MHWEISLIILGLAFVLLALFALPVLIQVRRTARSVDRTLQHVNREIPGILQNLQQTSANIRSTTETVRNLPRQVSAVVDECRSVKGQAAGIESRLKREFEVPAFAGLLPAGRWLAVGFGLIRVIRFIRSPQR